MKVWTKSLSAPGAASILFLIFTFLNVLPVSGSKPDILHNLAINHCLDCHDDETETRLDMDTLGFDLEDPDQFRFWEAIYDQIDSGAMPPAKKPRIDKEMREVVLNFLETALTTRSRAHQTNSGRAGIRRLTNLEYQNSVHALLSITTPLSEHLPQEMAAGFTTSDSGRGISPVHIKQYLKAADQAVHTLRTAPGGNSTRSYLVNYPKSSYMHFWFDRPWKDGGDNTLLLDDAIVAFKRTDFIWRTDRNGFKANHPGIYRVRGEARAYQAFSPVTLILYKAFGVLSHATYLNAWDIDPGESIKFEIEVSLNTDDYILPVFTNLLQAPDGKSLFRAGTKNYRGEGIAMKHLHIEGPLNPGRSQLLGARHLKELDSKNFSMAQILELLEPFTTRAFRRPASQGELTRLESMVSDALAGGAKPSMAMADAVRYILTSPQFLFLSPEPGQLDGYSLASRLSYFLWKFPPDETLNQLAGDGMLMDPDVLRSQVDRMIDHPGFENFVGDFMDQWLRLKDIDATLPDYTLYPEYNDMTRQAMLDESTMFFTHLVRENRNRVELIDAPFTFLNRELAEHYGIKGVKGQQMRWFQLPKGHPRGGILGQAAIHKVTANGTSTSPVRRGNFVLSQLLGKPAPPPPPDAGTLEPDIRGTSSIRERLEAHRNHKSCKRCHQLIDPPGFALESFDPIGQFRTHYRRIPDSRTRGRSTPELPVDSSGITPDGMAFSSFTEFKWSLKNQELRHNQILQNLTEQLIIYATGAKIQFADRHEIKEIVTRVVEENLGMRDLFHLIIQSDIFTHR